MARAAIPILVLGLAACGSEPQQGTGGADTTSSPATTSSSAASSSTSSSSGTGGAGGSCWVAPTYPLSPDPPGFAGLSASGPLVIDGETGTLISDKAISNPDGDCVVVKGGASITLDHLAIGPCGGDGVRIEGGSAITVRRSFIHDTTGNGVDVYQTSGVVVEDTHFVKVQTGVYAQEALSVVVQRSSFLDVQGPEPRGQLVQFNGVTGPGNRISCNTGQNVLGQSGAEDAINLFDSHGDPASPILVEGNRIFGGGPSESGGGILLGDGGGSHQIARHNVLVDPGQYGMGIAAGTEMTIADNLVFGKSQSFTNIGIYVYDFYEPAPCGGVIVQGNRVDFTNADGAMNPYWDGGNCGAITESGNDFAAALSPSIADAAPDVCAPCK